MLTGPLDRFRAQGLSVNLNNWSRFVSVNGRNCNVNQRLYASTDRVQKRFAHNTIDKAKALSWK